MNSELATTDQDATDQDATDLGRLVLSFLATKRSVNTRQAYGRDLRDYVAWCDQHGIDPLAADETAVAVYMRHLEATSANTTVARKVTTLSSFYAWCVQHTVMQANPCTHLARPVVDYHTSATNGLDKDGAVALLNAADADPNPRTAALASVLLYTGARISEILSADIEDLATDNGYNILRVTRKGGKIAKLMIPAPAKTRLDAYLATRDDYTSVPMTRDDATRPQRRALFATRTGKRMFRAEVRKLLQRLARSAGLPEDLLLSPHSMRHTYATLALDAGVELQHVQDSMGHADPRTTRRYDHNRNNLHKAPGNVLAGYLGVCRLSAIKL